MKILDSDLALTVKTRAIPFYRLFPSIITVLALCLGITAVRYGLDNKFEIAAALIIIAGIMDGMDGRIARLLKSTSEFGAHLDSLADIVSFGVAPGLVTYLWILRDIQGRGIGWLVVLIYISCAALRLARFNVQSIGIKPKGHNENKILYLKNNQIDQVTQEDQNQGKYSLGIPMPAAAALCLTPMIASFELLSDISFNPYLVAFYMILIGILMISTVPTFLIKHIGINHKHIRLILLLSASISAGLLLEPWLLIPPLSLLYLISIPILFFKRKKL